jgi:hypothetical protein
VEILAVSIELPPISAWFFFLLHLICALTHFSSTILLMSRWAVTSGLQTRTRVFGIMAHLGGGLLHVFLGINSFFGLSLRFADGTVPWWSMSLLVMMAIGLPAYLVSAQRDMLERANRETEGGPD